jgi:hypothetical protein
MANRWRFRDAGTHVFLCRFARERILAAELRIPVAASPEFGFNSLEK